MLNQMDEFHRLFMSFIPKDLGKQNADVSVFLLYNAHMGQFPNRLFFLQKKCFSSLLNDIYYTKMKIVNKKGPSQDNIVENFLHWFICL